VLRFTRIKNPLLSLLTFINNKIMDWNLLEEAAFAAKNHNDYGALISILDNNNVNMRNPNYPHETILIKMMEGFDNDKLVTFLLSKGADYYAEDDNERCPLLFFYLGLYYDNYKTKQKRIEYYRNELKIDLNRPTKKGSNILYWALQKCASLYDIKLLTSLGINIMYREFPDEGKYNKEQVDYVKSIGITFN